MATRTKSYSPGVEPVEGRQLLAAVGGAGADMTPRDVNPVPPVQPPRPAEDLGAVVGVTDPSAIKQGDTVYVFSSGPGIDIRASRDLVHWQKVGQVFDRVPDWARARVPGTSGIWAPDVSYAGGEYRVYYAVSTFGGQRSVIGLATNTTLDPTAPGYRWVDRGEVVESRPGRDNFNAIDPNAVTDRQGNAWLAFGSQWSGVKLLRLDPATGKPAAAPGLTARSVSARAARPVALASRPSGLQIEAPFLFERGGSYYLFVSFDRCCLGANSTYKIEVGRSATVAGPYLDRSGRPMTRGGGTLVLAGSGRWRGPGSNGVLADGGRDWLVNQAYDALNGGRPTLQVRPLAWTPDGWPVAGDPLA